MTAAVESVGILQLRRKARAHLSTNGAHPRLKVVVYTHGVGATAAPWGLILSIAGEPMRTPRHGNARMLCHTRPTA